jgi:hypothetical protein
LTESVGRPSRRPPTLILAAVLGVAAIGLIAAAVLLGGPPREPLAPGVTPPPSPVTGIVVNVRSEGLDRVLSFQVRDADGGTWTFGLDLVNPLEFPAGHLAVHQADAYPVIVDFRVEGGALVATRLRDATPGQG